MRISDWSSDVCSSDLVCRFWVILRDEQRGFKDDQGADAAVGAAFDGNDAGGARGAGAGAAGHAAADGVHGPDTDAGSGSGRLDDHVDPRDRQPAARIPDDYVLSAAAGRPEL